MSTEALASLKAKFESLQRSVENLVKEKQELKTMLESIKRGKW